MTDRTIGRSLIYHLSMTKLRVLSGMRQTTLNRHYKNKSFKL